MPTTLVTADVVGLNQTYIFGATGDIFVLTAGTSIVANGYSYLYGTASGINVTIDGYLWLEGVSGSFGSPFYFAGNDRITIGPDAQVVLRSSTGVTSSTINYSGIMLGQGSFGEGLGGTQFANHGHITTTGGGGFVASGGSNDLRNHGTIDVTNGSFNYGSGSLDSLLNTGMITGRSTSGSGLINMQGANNRLTNTGDIVVDTINVAAIKDISTGGTTVITNSGTITATGGAAVEVGNASLHLTNSGTMIGGVLTFDGTNRITNTGHIVGNISFGNSADVFRGIGGTLEGNIDGGDGADTYFTSDAGLGIVEAVGEGIDTVFSTVSFRLAANVDKLTLIGAATTGVGNAIANTIVGNGLDNRIYGLAGTDNLLGGEGDDRIGGGDGNDTLQGQDGDDWLRGAVGNDSLTAGNDNDTLIGAIGVDTLRGGTGNDSFVFAWRTDSGITAATSDLIADFVRGQDVIDLAGIDARTTTPANDAFTSIGAAAFSNVAGQMRSSSAAGVTTVAMDVNGNGVADMTIRLTGTLALTAQDFIL